MLFPQHNQHDSIDPTCWTDRIPSEEAARIFRLALQNSLLTEQKPALLFHHLGYMKQRMQLLKEQFPVNTLHAIAIKSNPVTQVLKPLIDMGAGLEAASYEEAAVAIAAGCAPSKLVFDSPAKTQWELSQALHAGMHINADNEQELARIALLLKSIDSSSTIGLRVNPGVGKGSISITSVGHHQSKFGIPLFEDPHRIIALFTEYPWLTGLHVHVGSQGCDLALLSEAVKITVRLQQRINQSIGHKQVQIIDIGGGLPTRYQDHAPAIALEEYVARLRQTRPELFATDNIVITEFGRALQANCGWAVSQVEYVKHNSETPIAVIHLGADYLLRNIYHPDDWVNEFVVLDANGQPKTSPAQQRWSIAGPLCFAGDILARGLALPDIEPGDFIMIRDTGAYSLSMWSRHCSRGMPALIGYDADQAEPLSVLRAAESAENIADFWSATTSTPPAGDTQ